MGVVTNSWRQVLAVVSGWRWEIWADTGRYTRQYLMSIANFFDAKANGVTAGWQTSSIACWSIWQWLTSGIAKWMTMVGPAGSLMIICPPLPRENRTRFVVFSRSLGKPPNTSETQPASAHLLSPTRILHRVPTDTRDLVAVKVHLIRSDPSALGIASYTMIVCGCEGQSNGK